MINIKWVSCIALVFCVLFASTGIRAQEITVFDSIGAGIALAPDGSVWFSPGFPTRLMRIVGNTVHEIDIFGYYRFELDTPCQIAFAPKGQMWLEQQAWEVPPPRSRFYSFDQYQGLSEIDINADFWQEESRGGMFFDSENHYYGIYYRYNSRSQSSAWGLTPGVNFYRLWRLSHDDSETVWGAMELSRPVFTFGRSAWIGCYSINIYTGDLYEKGLYRIDLETGDELANYTSEDGISDRYSSPRFFDASGRLWILSHHQIMTFDGNSFDVFEPFAGDELHSDLLAMDANGTIWTSGDQTVSWYNEGQTGTYAVGDGLPTGEILDCLIDFDGYLWLQHEGGMLARISNGGWPPMRLRLSKLETPDSIAVVANLFNTQPVVGVDVYIACQIGDSLLFYPCWTPEPSPIQINLYAGFNQTATIISAPRAHIPPGTYTFYGCMTGRNTGKLIGPLDRKFEVLTVEVGAD